MPPVTKVFNITLDVSVPLTNEEFRVKQGDTGNVFVISLVDGGVPIDLSNCRVNAMFTKGEHLAMQDNWTDDGGVTIGGEDHNVVTIELFNGSFLPGLNTCELQVFSGDALDVLVTTASFNFRCALSLFNEQTIMAMREYSLLTSLIASVQAVVSGAQSDWNEQNATSQQYIKNKPAIMPPTSHASSHASSGVDAITPASIGAATASHSTAHMPGGTDPLTPASIGAAVVRAEQVVLTPADWVGTESPYTKQVNVDAITAACHIIPAPALTYEEAYADCMMKVSAQGERVITFSCEDKPQAAIVVNLLVIYDNAVANQGITTDADDEELTNMELLSMWNS